MPTDSDHFREYFPESMADDIPMGPALVVLCIFFAPLLVVLGLLGLADSFAKRLARSEWIGQARWPE